ncbi:hypothetical protein [Haloarcula halophila]|uniref:hypothetical protein n=1 Tax=Haloarcula TaxID=2237 RepID=UPI0023E3EA39|nr:hypothetical protein [Halomicroarcula sp. DFY41]
MSNRISRREFVISSAGIVSASLAGCASLGGPNISEEEYPAGTSQDGITDPATIVGSTRTALANNGYDVKLEHDGTTLRFHSSLQDSRHYRKVGDADFANEVLLDEGMLYIKYETHSGYEYYTGKTERSFSDFHASNSYYREDLPGDEEILWANIIKHIRGYFLQNILEVSEFAPVQATDRSGRAVVEFEIESVSQDAFDDTVTGSSGSLIVDPESVSRSVEIQVRTSSSGETSTAENRRYQVQELGNTVVSRPSWVEEEFQ